MLARPGDENYIFFEGEAARFYQAQDATSQSAIDAITKRLYDNPAVDGETVFRLDLLDPSFTGQNARLYVGSDYSLWFKYEENDGVRELTVFDCMRTPLPQGPVSPN